MKQGTWRAAFTIVLDGQQIDLMELSSISRTQILLQLQKAFFFRRVQLHLQGYQQRLCRPA